MPDVISHGVEIHYEVAGDGPPLVLLHSFLCSGEMWRGQVPQLSERCRTINVDARGHGASGHVARPFSLLEMVDDTTAVLDGVGVERAIWAGLSVGGMVALRAALVAPERVSGLILLDTDAGNEGTWPRLKYRGLAVVARLLGLRPLRGQIARQMFGTTSIESRPALVEEWSDRFARVHVPSALRMLDALVRRDDISARLTEIAVPAVVVVGAEDRSLPPARSRRLAAALPHATLHEIEGAGHLSALEQPDAVTRAVLSFLDSLEPRG
jgi:3-oxoadipate enol-lactonase